MCASNMTLNNLCILFVSTSNVYTIYPSLIFQIHTAIELHKTTKTNICIVNGSKQEVNEIC